jgi:hypothetical protein
MNSNTLRHRRTKRTTVTLEADVADFLQQILSQNKELKEKELINKLLRAGIKNERRKTNIAFKVKGFKTKLVNEISTEELEKLLDEI